MQEILSQMKNITIYENKVTIRSRLDEDSRKILSNLAEEISDPKN